MTVARFDVVQLDPARHPAARASEFMTIDDVTLSMSSHRRRMRRDDTPERFVWSQDDTLE